MLITKIFTIRAKDWERTGSGAEQQVVEGIGFFGINPRQRGDVVQPCSA